jgi:antitoxin MazE
VASRHDAAFEAGTRCKEQAERRGTAAAKAARPHANQRVKLSLEDGCVVIAPQASKRLSRDERPAHDDPALHGGEVMAAVPLGAEAVTSGCR